VSYYLVSVTRASVATCSAPKFFSWGGEKDSASSFLIGAAATVAFEFGSGFTLMEA